MLSAFTAQQLVEFKPRDKSKLESILVHGNDVRERPLRVALY